MHILLVMHCRRLDHHRSYCRTRAEQLACLLGVVPPICGYDCCTADMSEQVACCSCLAAKSAITDSRRNSRTESLPLHSPLADNTYLHYKVRLKPQLSHVYAATTSTQHSSSNQASSAGSHTRGPGCDDESTRAQLRYQQAAGMQ